ncbi:SGNH/GDSL hydrolase family protein [Fredinandcohnia sp. 179-A 10B2 NHS]|uniref:SGNH/GDSL hydrolase family protein n=1 Tax=Fredinandcohnia sp. 179-A 10B2 NHS TaxID=3235176 RepID=UPI0039A27641
MNKRKFIIMIVSLLVVAVGSLIYILSLDSEETIQAINAVPPVLEEKVEVVTATVPVEEQVPEQEMMESTDNDEAATTFKEGLKEKVREVIVGTIKLFKPEDLRIVAIGDSLTQGVGDETESGGYVGILNHTFEDNNLNISIENYGKKGNRTDQLLKRLEKKEIQSSIEKADTVLVTIGANDIMQVAKNNLSNLNMDPFIEEQQGYTERLTAIFTKINELNPDTQIYLIGFYNPFEQYFSEIEELGIIASNWNAAGKTVTDEYENAHFIPVADLFTGAGTSLLADDYFHPNTSGYKLIAKRVLEHMNELSIDTDIHSETELDVTEQPEEQP